MVTWAILQARQILFRSRAERLLADIKALELNRSSWSDAQKLMTRWGKWGSWYGDCNPEDCFYSIRIYHLPLVYPNFGFEQGPHLVTRALELGGLRSAGITAQFHVVHGVVTNREFGVSSALPVKSWITPGGDFWLRDKIGSTYWPTLDVAFREGAKLDVGNSYLIARHPNHGLIHRRTILEVHFTPDETPEEQSALTDFRFDCLTRWTACSSRGELLPRAAAEDEADERAWGTASEDADLELDCLPTVQIRAREEQNILVGEITRSKALPKLTDSNQTPIDSWLTDIRLQEVLKGKAPVSTGEILRVVIYCKNGNERCSQPSSRSRYILMGESVPAWSNVKDQNFFSSVCGVVPATPENLGAARAGVQQDFGPIY